MYFVGLTGQIASGKSLAAEAFKNLGIHTFSADDINRQLLLPNTLAYQAICNHFGQRALQSDGFINKNTIRNIITHDSDERLWLERLLHPLIREALQAAITHANGPYCVIEIPLLTKKADYPYLNRILLINCPSSLQLQRLMARNHLTQHEALALLQIQPSMQIYNQIADDAIINDKLKTNFVSEIKKLHQKYLQYAAQKS